MIDGHLFVYIYGVIKGLHPYSIPKTLVDHLKRRIRHTPQKREEQWLIIRSLTGTQTGHSEEVWGEKDSATLHRCGILTKARHRHFIKTSGNCDNLWKKKGYNTSPLRLKRNVLKEHGLGRTHQMLRITNESRWGVICAGAVSLEWQHLQWCTQNLLRYLLPLPYEIISQVNVTVHETLVAHANDLNFNNIIKKRKEKKKVMMLSM